MEARDENPGSGGAVAPKATVRFPCAGCDRSFPRTADWKRCKRCDGSFARECPCGNVGIIAMQAATCVCVGCFGTESFLCTCCSEFKNAALFQMPLIGDSVLNICKGCAYASGGRVRLEAPAAGEFVKCYERFCAAVENYDLEGTHDLTRPVHDMFRIVCAGRL